MTTAVNSPPDLTKVIERRSKYPVAVGGFSDVYKATLADGRIVAVKLVRVIATSSMKKCLEREAKFWHDLDHPHVLKFLGTCVIGHQLGLVSVWLLNGTALEYIKKESNADRLLILLQTGSALDYLHGREIVHGDVKGANILIDDSGNALLTDFGLARVRVKFAGLTPTPTAIHNAGSVRFMAPELLKEEENDPHERVDRSKIDVFSFGRTILELMTGSRPFPEVARDDTVLVRVLQGCDPRRPADFCDALWELCLACWERDPNARPTIAAVLRRLKRLHRPVVIGLSDVPTMQRGRKRPLLESPPPPPTLSATAPETSTQDPSPPKTPLSYLGAHKRRRTNPLIQFDTDAAPLSGRSSSIAISTKRKITEHLAGSSTNVARGRQSALGPKDRIGSRLVFVQPSKGSPGDLQSFSEKTGAFRRPLPSSPMDVNMEPNGDSDVNDPRTTHPPAELQDYDEGWDAVVDLTAAGPAENDKSDPAQIPVQDTETTFEEPASADKDTISIPSFVVSEPAKNLKETPPDSSAGVWKRTIDTSQRAYRPLVDLKSISLQKSKATEAALGLFTLNLQDVSLSLSLKDIKSNQEGPLMRIDHLLKDNVAINAGASYGHEVLEFFLATWRPTWCSARVKLITCEPGPRGILNGLIAWLAANETFIHSSIPEEPGLSLVFFSSQSGQLGRAWKVSEQLLCLSDTLIVALVSRLG